MADNYNEQYVEPEVSRIKYDEELKRFDNLFCQWEMKGVFLIKEEFPFCEFLFLTPQIFPFSGVFGVRIDFTNYDAAPPSVKFINPYTGKPVKREQIPFQFKQKAISEGAQMAILNQSKDVSDGIDICLSIGGKQPFLCHPGIKEYHDHPYHTGDSWHLHRSKGEGRLYRILQILHTHSIALVEEIQVQILGGQSEIILKQRKP